MFKFGDYHLVGTSEVKPSMKAAKEEACAQIRQDLHYTWDEISRGAEPKLHIPCLHCLVLLRPHAIGEHLMLEHTETALETRGRAVDVSFQRKVADAIAKMKEIRDGLSDDTEL